MSTHSRIPNQYKSSPSDGGGGLRLAVWGSLFALGLFVAWAYHADIDQITRGQGQIIASSRTQIIQAPDGGVLEDLRVREGAEVQRGEVLALLDRTKVEAAIARQSPSSPP